jgi:predicted SprT family Zn-dependent metalloprotease
MSDTNDRAGGEGGDDDAVEAVDRFAVGPGSTHEEFLAAAKLYAREVVERRDLAVDVSRLEWEVSTRAKRRAGAVTYRDGDPRTVRLTWAHFQNEGWAAAAATVRHELIHVHLLNEADDASHGEAFRRLADRLDTHVNCERFVDPEWWVTCTDCGARLARYRRSKLVKRPDRYQCSDCGGAFRVDRAD